eukprot:7018681-Prymnesium_polylepis.1
MAGANDRACGARTWDEPVVDPSTSVLAQVGCSRMCPGHSHSSYAPLFRVRGLTHRVCRRLQLDTAHFASMRTSAAVIKYRTTAALYSTASRLDIPAAIQPIVSGSLCEVRIDDVFARTTCFVNVQSVTPIKKTGHFRDGVFS